MQQFILVAENPHLPYEGEHLREYRGIGGSLYSEIQRIDEDRVEYGVEHHCEYRGIHSLPRFSGSP